MVGGYFAVYVGVYGHNGCQTTATDTSGFNKAELTVVGTFAGFNTEFGFAIISSEPPENVIALSNELNEKLNAIMNGTGVSLTQGLILAALDFADEAKKSTALAEKYKNEIADYLEDAEKAMTQRDKYKRELDKLKAKNNK